MFNDLSDRTKIHFENPIMLAATFMDPRFRSFKFIKDQSDRDLALYRAKAYIKTAYSYIFSKTSEPENIFVEIPELEKVSKKQKNFSLLCEEDDDESLEQQLSFSEIIIGEIKNYQKLKTTLTDTMCPLQFYKFNCHQLPNMAKIAKNLFCITASSVPSECLFSKTGELISKKRARLSPSRAEELLMLSVDKFD